MFGLTAAGIGPAQAGPPYVTDDPEPTNVGKWEIYAFSTGRAFDHAADRGSGFDINYGGARDLQLSTVVSLAYERHDGAASHTGFADIEVGSKYRFLHQQEGSWVPDLSLFPKIELPTAGRRFGSGKLGFPIPLWGEKDFGPWSVLGGGGWTLNLGVGNRDYEFGGIALTRQVAKALSLGGEIYHLTADTIDARAGTGISLGASWQLAPKWSIIGSGGPLIQHRASGGNYAFYVALEFHD